MNLRVRSVTGLSASAIFATVVMLGIGRSCKVGR